MALGLAGYIRLAPSHPARWHRPIAENLRFGPPGVVLALKGGALLRLVGNDLAGLNRLVLADDRSELLAGSVKEGRLTWVTRSAFWGFPDYTTTELRPGGVYIHARLRFGVGDRGVNAARLRDWAVGLAGS